MVSAIVQLGGSLRKAVVAEGIESAAQMEHLRELGCRFGQGFHLSNPMSAPVAAEWLVALEASYTMEEQRSHHHGNVHVDVSTGVEFF